MIAIISQCWTLDDGEHAEGYMAGYRDFDAMHEAAQGYHGRRLMRGNEDRCHFTNVRFFDSHEDYERLYLTEGYVDHINAMSPHLDLSRPPVKEVVTVEVAGRALA